MAWLGTAGTGSRVRRRINLLLSDGDSIEAGLLTEYVNAQGTLARSGSYMSPMHDSRNAGAPTQDRLYFVPIFARRSATFDRIAVENTADPGGTALWRVGIYADNLGVPGAALYRSGSFTATGISVETHDLTSVLPVTPGTYWLACVAQVAVGQVRQMNGGMIPVPDTGAGSTGIPTHYYQSSVSGALPDPAVVSGIGTAAPPLIQARIV